MNKRFLRLGSITLAAVALGFLTGCPSDAGVEMDLSTPPKIRDTVLDCDSAKEAKAILENGSDAALVEVGFTDPEDQEAIDSAKKSVDGEIQLLCADGPKVSESPTVEPEATESPSPEATETSEATPSPTVSASAKETESELVEPSVEPPPTLDPMEVRTWGEFIEFAPEGLIKTVDDNADKTGLTWDEIEKLADLRDDGALLDARMIVSPDEAPDVEKARIEAGVEDSNVKVITMTGCIDVATDVACPTGTFLTYAVTKMTDKGPLLVPGVGIAVIRDNLVPIIYQRSPGR